MYLLDTVVVSATRLPHRNPEVARWLRRHQDDDLLFSVFTIGEIQQGIELAPNTAMAEELQEWLDAFSATFREQIVPFLEAEARRWGIAAASLQIAGRPAPLVDSLIAATALHHGLTVVTRNVKDFDRFDVPVINPWDDENGA